MVLEIIAHHRIQETWHAYLKNYVFCITLLSGIHMLSIFFNYGQRKSVLNVNLKRYRLLYNLRILQRYRGISQ